MNFAVKGTLAAAAVVLACPAAAQDPGVAARGAKALAMLQDVYKAEPLTTAQQARLSAARRAVAIVLPNGFYARLMQSTMSRMLGPLLSQMANPSNEEFARQLGYEGSAIPNLDDAKRKHLVAIIDPAADQRVKLFLDVFTQAMSDMMGKLEGPIRDGLAQSYAVRFDDRQLSDINAFFATPTGSTYASQSMEAFTDPQTMGKMMQAMPLIIQQMPQMLSGLQAKMGDLPKPRGFADLRPDERQELASAFGISVEQLRANMVRVARKDNTPGHVVAHR